MGNKWEICIDVDEEDVRILAEVLAPRTRKDPTRNARLARLTSQINLAWIEKEVEIVPPPSQWSATQPMAVGSDVLRRDAPYPSPEMVRKWHSGGGGL